MIRVHNVKFSYDKSTPVLHNITLEENEPVIAGLWGRNGAGKTTLMKLLAGHQRPDSGRVEIMGASPYNNIAGARHVCYMQEEHPLSVLWMVQDALRFGSYFNDGWDMDLANRLLDEFRLDRKKKVAKLSKGMKSALQFIIGISSHAPVTILDEPSNGLDAGMRKKMYEVLRESHEDQPRLIMLSSHHIEEVQPICESLIVMHNGQMLMQESMDDIREKGVWLTGEQSKLQDIIVGQYVLEQSIVGSVMKVMLDVPYSKKWKDIAGEHGLTIEKAKVQEYLLNMTDKEEITS